MSFFPICLYKKAYKFGFLNIIFSRKKKKKKTTFFLHTRPGFPWTRPGLGNVVLHEGCKTTLVRDISMTIMMSFFTSFSRQFLPTYKRGVVPNFFLIKNVVILA